VLLQSKIERLYPSINPGDILFRRAVSVSALEKTRSQGTVTVFCGVSSPQVEPQRSAVWKDERLLEITNFQQIFIFKSAPILLSMH
jgi:hypothetical protein